MSLITKLFVTFLCATFLLPLPMAVLIHPFVGIGIAFVGIIGCCVGAIVVVWTD